MKKLFILIIVAFAIAGCEEWIEPPVFDSPVATPRPVPKIICEDGYCKVVWK